MPLLLGIGFLIGLVAVQRIRQEKASEAVAKALGIDDL